MRIPKFSSETENSVLGTLINLGSSDATEVQKAMLYLNADCFYKPYAKAIYGIIERCYRQKENFSIVEMLDYLKSEDHEIFDFFQKAIQGVYFSKAQLSTRVDTLITLSNLRKQLTIMENILDECNVEKIPAQAAMKLREGIGKIGRVSLSRSLEGSSIEHVTERYLADYYKSDELVRTGVNYLDDALKGGFPNRSLVTICGDSGMGKTFFSAYLLAKMTDGVKDKQSLFFSLEMPENKIWERLVGIVGRKSIDYMSETEIALAIKRLHVHPLTIFEENFKDIDTIETVCRVKAIEKPLSVVVIDYLALVDNSGQFESNHLRQADIAKRLSSLALELNCIVLALSQANREPSRRSVNDRCPYMTDSADSSGGYRSATLWLGIDRPELHDEEFYLKNQFVVKCRKNRYGSNFELVWAFNDGVFEEVDQVNHFQKPLKEVIKKTKYEYKNDY